MKVSPFSKDFPEAKIHENGQVYSEFPIELDGPEYRQTISTYLLLDNDEAGKTVKSYDQEKVNTIIGCVRIWKESKGKKLSDLAEVFMNTPEFEKEKGRIYNDFKAIINDRKPDLKSCVIGALSGEIFVPKALLNVFYRYATQINLANEAENDEMGM